MSLIYNGTEIPIDGTISFNGSNVEKVIYNGTTVWEQSLWDGVIVDNYEVQENDAFTYSGDTKMTVNYNGEKYFKITIKDATKFNKFSIVKTTTNTYDNQGWELFAVYYNDEQVYFNYEIKGASEPFDFSEYITGDSKELQLWFGAKSNYWHGNVRTVNIEKLYLLN
jgi:hypothetical protein